MISELQETIEQKEREIDSLSTELFAMHNPEDCARFIIDCATQEEYDWVEDMINQFRVKFK